MATIEQLTAYGADVKTGVDRCMGNQSFYLRMVGMLREDNNLEMLRAALGKNDLKAAFEAAHALKGVLANLSLTPALKPVSEITELLRIPVEMDYQPLLAEVEREMEKLCAIL